MPGSHYEELTLHPLKALFPTISWQKRIRPDWLHHTPTGCNLELELYHVPVKLAVQIHGPHHY